MGGRLSVPRSSDGLSETSRPTRPSYRTINGRTLTAPLAAVTMAAILFVYARTSIRAAKLNAQKHRETDGGQLNWGNESRRRHGQLAKVDDGTLLKEALMGDKKPTKEAARGQSQLNSEPAKALEQFKRERAVERYSHDN